MLPKRNRLTAADFKMARGWRVLHSPHFLFRFTRGLASRSSRAAAVVSAAVSQKAVARNRLRRRIYSILAKRLPKEEKYTLAVHAKQGAAALSFPALDAELTACLARLR